jgi:hypothetical protein
MTVCTPLLPHPPRTALINPALAAYICVVPPCHHEPALDQQVFGQQRKRFDGQADVFLALKPAPDLLSQNMIAHTALWQGLQPVDRHKHDLALELPHDAIVGLGRWRQSDAGIQHLGQSVK